MKFSTLMDISASMLDKIDIGLEKMTSSMPGLNLVQYMTKPVFAS